MDALLITLRRTRRRRATARLTDATFVAVGVAGLLAAIALPFHLGPTIPLAGTLLMFAVVWRPGPSLADTAAWLDGRHHLHDLLASAWAIRPGSRADGWTDSLRSMAAATAAALPPPGRLARFSPRHHVCLAAGVIAVALTSNLTNSPPSAVAPKPSAGPIAAASASPTDRPIRHTASESRRAADTAESASRLPTPAPTADASAAGTPKRPHGSGDAAAGQGRADSDRSAAPPIQTSSTALAPSASGRAGSGHATVSTGGDGPPAGRVDGLVSANGMRSLLAAATGGRPRAETHAMPVPAAYRDLVRDYFAR